MLYCKKCKGGETVKLYICDMIAQADALAPLLPADQKNEKRKYEKAAGAYLLKTAAADFGVTDLRTRKNRYGRPYLVHNGGVYFNISHSENIAVLAADTSKIGVDIEKIRQADLRVLRKFACEREKIWVESGADESERNRRFFALWTAKEAYIKYMGKGFYMPLQSFELDFSGERGEYTVKSRRRSLEFTVDCDTLPGFIISTVRKSGLKNKFFKP